jgi:hypothetical protein
MNAIRTALANRKPASRLELAAWSFLGALSLIITPIVIGPVG